jgi:hypothetical protein
MLFTGTKEISWIIRDALTQCDDYTCAYDYLSETHIAALGYIILAGTKDNEGVIIARENKGVANVRTIGEDDGIWYLVQTNSDHWTGDCP